MANLLKIRDLHSIFLKKNRYQVEGWSRLSVRSQGLRVIPNYQNILGTKLW
jgi:hypothetical protein